MTTSLKLDLSARQFSTLYEVVFFPCPGLSAEDRPARFSSEVLVAAMERLRDAIGSYGETSLVDSGEDVTLKLALSPHEEAVLLMLLAEDLSYRQAMGTMLESFTSDVVAILAQVAGYMEAREAARLLS